MRLRTHKFRNICLKGWAGSLLLFGSSVLLPAWANSEGFQADKIFYGGPIISLDEEHPDPEAVAIAQGRIVALGSTAHIMKMQTDDTELIDLQGQALMPGFIDAHTHPILSAMMSQTLDLSGFTHKTSQQVIEALQEGVSAAGKGDWIIGYGWDPAQITDLQTPHIHWLDQIAPDNPLLILTQTLHTAFANSQAFERAGITASTPDLADGYFEKDSQGRLTGTVIEVGAIAQFRKVLPKYPLPAYEYLLTGQLEKYAQAGYTTIVAPGLQPVFPGYLQSYQRLANHSNTPVRSHVYLLPEEMDKDTGETGREVELSQLQEHTVPAFQVQGVKVWIDGSPYAGGMAMEQAYLENTFTLHSLGIPAASRGHLHYQSEQLNELVAKYHQQGWQVAAHVQGERAIDQFLNAVTYARQQEPAQEHRHRMEHCALITPAQIKRAKQLGVTTSFYIEHLSYYGDALYEQIVGPQRANRFMPMGSAMAELDHVSLHTDSPSSPVNAFHAMQTAVMRQSQSGRHVLGEKEKLTVEQAIRAVTINGAWQIFEENSRGSISVGKLADFTLVSHDLRQFPVERWQEVTVIDTYLQGEKVEISSWSWQKTAQMWQLAIDSLVHFFNF